MRNLPLLLALLLLSVLLSAASAQASPLLVPTAAQPFAAVDDEDEADLEEDEEDEGGEEGCVIEDEEDVELCTEIAEEEREEAKAKEREELCVLDSAKAAVTVNPGKRRLRLSVHYKTLKPATVDVEASLQGPKGTVRLGTEHARFRRSGVYRDTFTLPERQMKKALVAREFSVALHVVNAPASCDVELTGASPRAKR
jgi:hypothetical protein